MKGKRYPYSGGGIELEHAGDYCGPVMGFTGERPAVFFVLPNGNDEGHVASIRHVTSPPHVFMEEDDGTLTIQPSISFEDRDRYHGYLENGTWRAA